MRVPSRIRGVILGVVTLVVGPIVSAAAFTPTEAPVAAVSHSVLASAEVFQVSGHEPLRAHELAFAPDPNPAPPPAAVVIHVSTPKTAAPPAPAPARVQVVYPPGSIAAIIMAAAAQFGVDGNWMIRISTCESHMNPNSVNHAGPYIGLFQFLPSTFAAHGGTNIYDPTQQATIAANMLAHGGARSWPVCSRR